MIGDDDDTYQLVPSHVNLLDANALISAGRPSTAKYRQFRREALAAEVTLLMSERVAEEVRVGGIGTSLDTATNEGWITVVKAPSFTHSDATNAHDIARRTIAAKSPEKEEYEVEKADAVLAGLAVECLKRKNEGDEVTVVTADGPAQQGIITAVSALGYDNQIHPVTLFDIIGEDGEDINII